MSKVSIIVPVYNTGSKLRKCMESLVNQTMQDIEIVIVNDGSTDNTRNIIDNISKYDSRVKILHKENAGVSAARNSGIEASTGEYVVFVDGDDYIAQEYVEYMISLIEKTESDFCLSKCCYTKSGEIQTENEYIEKLQPEDATALLLSPNVIVGCWNKIFKRSLIVDNNVWFSTTLFYGEGLNFITTLAQVSKSVGVGNRKVYYYRRNNEASATTKFDIDKLRNGERALKIIRQNMVVINDKVDVMYALHMSLFSLGAVIRIKANKQERKFDDDYKHWKKTLKFYARKILFKKEVSMYRKLMLICGYMSPWMMLKLDCVRRRKIVKNSVD